MKTAVIRQKFIEHFIQQGHKALPSSSLVPVDDDTLLFTNAGMVQFKDAFLGADRGYTRAVTAQRCVRAGGKHNDLDNVGYTARHHTFFEMLGNFSFGDYFKREAIQFSWDFLTKVLGLSEKHLWITVYQDDDEAADIWLKEIGVSPERFSRCDEKDNFWAMGDTGPCGPCSEIFYDHGPEVPGGPPGSPDAEADRYIEIWNLVFMQYVRDANGTLSPLPKPCVDTGMGLERIAAVMQGVHNNYEIDLFVHLLAFAAKKLGVSEKQHHALRVIVDHIRSAAFLIVDGVLPGNEGRGYVLRRIIRRAIRHGKQLGAKAPFFASLVQPLVEVMGEAYPELLKAQAQVEKVLDKEEQQFLETLDKGLKLLSQAMDKAGDKTLPGDVIFKLYDTYGFPADLTADIAREHQMTLDMKGFEACMAKQRERARGSGQFKAAALQIVTDAKTTFCGYDTLTCDAKILGLYQNNQPVDTVSAGQAAVVLLDKTPFYAESGGQVGDKGILDFGDGRHFRVNDTQKVGDAIAHVGALMSRTCQNKEKVSAQVDDDHRLDTIRHHSATHLLHAALREVLGDTVQQKGSLVGPERLRLDFSYQDALSENNIQAIEALVNAQIMANTPIETQLMSIEKAMKSGAMALFGEKYGAKVRVLSMGGKFSVELCGGTHAERTGDLGLFKIISESGVAAGVRRIEAVAGRAYMAYATSLNQLLSDVRGGLRAETFAQIPMRVQGLQDKLRQQEKTIKQLTQQLATGGGQDLSEGVVTIEGVKVLATTVPAGDAKSLRDSVDKLRQKLGDAIVVLGVVNEGRVSLVAGVTKSLSKRVPANELMKHVAEQVGGKGGGRPDMAQGGGEAPEHLEKALASVAEWAKSRLV